MSKNPNHKNFYEVLSFKKGDILIVDPYVLNLPDLTNAKLDFPVPIVRVRRPFWGKGNLSEFINKVSPEDLKKAMEELEDDN